MVSMTITVTDHTKTPRSIYDLAVNGSGGGYTVVGGMPALNVGASVCYLNIQASKTNSSTIIYKGDSSVKNDGTRQSKELAAGDSDQMEPVNPINVNEIFLAAGSDSTAKINVEFYMG